MRKLDCYLIFALLCFCPLQAVGVSTEQEIKDALLRQIVEVATLSLEQWDQTKLRFVPGDDISHHYLAPARILAWVYKTPHPMNPFYGDSRARYVAIEMGNIVADRNYKGQGGFEYHGEWPFYNLCETYALLENELPEDSQKLWRAYADFYVSTRGRRPMFYTAFNHEAGNVLAVLRAGQVFGVPEWIGQARRLMRQLIKVQSDLGYFNEGPQHGPSMRYNHVQLTTMLLYADYSGDGTVLPACKKLADFMIRYAFPDGSLIGALDGRQSWSLSRICYGLDRWPKGKELNRRVHDSWKKWGLSEPRSRYAVGSDMGAFWNGYWLLDECRSLLPDAPTEPLPQDLDGYRMMESDTTFSGGVVRHRDWMVALSAIYSDLAHLSGSIYRMDRQSRMDIWHEDTGLIIGGGSNRVERDHVPLANVLLLTGFREVDCDFGQLKGGSSLDKRATYFPRAVAASLQPEEQMLHEVFGQGDVWFKLEPVSREMLRVRYNYDVFSTKALFIQLPLIAFYNSTVAVDGSPFSGESVRLVKREVRISNPTTATEVRIIPPPGIEAGLRPPIERHSSYRPLEEQTYYRPLYTIYLLSVRIEAPLGKGEGEFQIQISKNLPNKG